MAYKDFSNLSNDKVLKYCLNLKVGDKIKFASDKQRYTVKAKDDRYIICTKPFNLKKTVLYTIIDLKRWVRGTNNMVFNPYDYSKQEDINECLVDLQYHNHGLEVTHRNCVQLDVEIN